MARKLHNTEVKVKLAERREDSDHAELIITERNTKKQENNTALKEDEILSLLSIGQSCLHICKSKLKSK